MSELTRRYSRIPAVSKGLGIPESHFHRMCDEHWWVTPTPSTSKVAFASYADPSHTELPVVVIKLVGEIFPSIRCAVRYLTQINST